MSDHWTVAFTFWIFGTGLSMGFAIAAFTLNEKWRWLAAVVCLGFVVRGFFP